MPESRRAAGVVSENLAVLSREKLVRPVHRSIDGVISA